MSDAEENRKQYDNFVDGLAADLEKLSEYYAKTLTQDQGDAAVLLANKMIRDLRQRNKGGATSAMVALTATKLCISVLNAQTGNVTEAANDPTTTQGNNSDE